jgi:nucleotide-binding universal stress UspA family protein
VIQISSILAPTDFSTHSARAVRYACQLAERLNAPLHLLHVLSEIVPAGPDPLLMPVMPPQFYKENEERALATLEQLPEPTWEKPSEVIRAVRWGSPVDTIVSYAIDHRIGMIVIATHGRSGLSHVLLGSVAEHIVRDSPCPVLTIRDNSRTPMPPAPSS